MLNKITFYTEEEKDINQNHECYDGTLKVDITGYSDLFFTKSAGFKFNNWAWTETAPLVFNSKNNNAYALIPSSKTIYQPINTGKTVMDEYAFDNTGSHMVTRSENINKGTAYQIKPKELGNQTYWRRNYYGVFDAYRKNGNFVAVIHGENKNDAFSINGEKLYYNNSIEPISRKYNDNEYSGRDSEGVYHDSPKHYFAFVGLSSCREDELQGDDSLMINDRGPITWPEFGYIDENGNSRGCGLRHPSIFCNDEYVYITYLEQSENGGTKIIRAKKDKDGFPCEFYKYSQGDFTQNALPRDFNKNDTAFLKMPSGNSVDILGMSKCKTMRFHIAKITGTDLFLGVQEMFHPLGYITVVLRVSRDLVHWSKYTELPNMRFAKWHLGMLHYPRIVNARFETVSEIDPKNFYIIGTALSPVTGADETQAVQLSIEII